MAEKPPSPDLPKYLREPLEKQSPGGLEMVATYARELAAWKRTQREAELERHRAEEKVDQEELEELDKRGISRDSADYDDVPASGAYITVNTTNETSETAYRYYYRQWRGGDSWKNE